MWRNYIGESGRRIVVRVKDHNGKNHKSYISKHSLETGHESVTSSDFFSHSQELQWKQKKAKNCRVMKQSRPTLNIQDKSVALKLFN